MFKSIINWFCSKDDIPNVTGMTLSEACKAMEGHPFHPAAYTLLRAAIVVIEKHEKEIQELKNRK